MCWFCADVSGGLLPPSPPREKAAARQIRGSNTVHTARVDWFAPATLATKVGFARTFGVSSIRTNSIRAIAIMTNAVDTNRIWALR